MIEFLQGELVGKALNYAVIGVNGVGFRVYVPATVVAVLPALKEEVNLFTYLHVREDELTLYGFLTQEDREVFTTLLTVSGIGPKLALAILSRLKGTDLKRAILLGDTQQLIVIPGVGKKTAERIILELKDKVGKQDMEEQQAFGHSALSDTRGQAVAALLALGYSLAEAQKAVSLITTDSQQGTVEDIIRLALRNMAK